MNASTRLARAAIDDIAGVILRNDGCRSAFLCLLVQKEYRAFVEKQLRLWSGQSIEPQQDILTICLKGPLMRVLYWQLTSHQQNNLSWSLRKDFLNWLIEKYKGVSVRNKRGFVTNVAYSK